MKKVAKKGKSILERKVNLTPDEKLNKIDVKALAPKKLAEANRRLKKLNSLPK